MHSSKQNIVCMFRRIFSLYKAASVVCNKAIFVDIVVNILLHWHTTFLWRRHQARYKLTSNRKRACEWWYMVKLQLLKCNCEGNIGFQKLQIS